MIAVLDPALFFCDALSGPLDDDEYSSLLLRIEDALRVCQRWSARVPDDHFYWGELQRELIIPLNKRIPKERPQLRQALDRLRGFAAKVSLPPLPKEGKSRIWGLKRLFVWNPSASNASNYVRWLDVMSRVLIGCVQTGENVVFIVRLVEGRNWIRHLHGRAVLDEKTCWRIHANVPGHAPVKIRCVRNLRNMEVPWTARMDEKLPNAGHFPYCPPEFWWRGSTQVHATIVSRPAWIDRFDNGWAQPSTGGSYHWDVFIRELGLQQKVGLQQINVSAWGSADRNRKPGEIHHTPGDKEPHLRANAGWKC